MGLDKGLFIWHDIEIFQGLNLTHRALHFSYFPSILTARMGAVFFLSGV
jgi:hypothetical protein